MDYYRQYSTPPAPWISFAEGAKIKYVFYLFICYFYLFCFAQVIHYKTPYYYHINRMYIRTYDHDITSSPEISNRKLPSNRNLATATP